MKTKFKIKSMSVLLALALTMTAFIANTVTASAAEETKIVLGDVNNDGKISILDVTDIQKYIAGLTDFTDNQVKAANAFEDDRIDINDVTELQRYIAGYKDVNKNIGKTWHEGETEKVWVFDSEPQLRYILIRPDVCNTCDKPFMHNDGTPWTTDERASHGMMHMNAGESAHWRTQYDWYYIDDNGKYHDLNDDGKVPHRVAGSTDTSEENIFDKDFNPEQWFFDIDTYNNSHSDKRYFANEMWASCNNCNSDGSSIFDEWGGTGNLKDGLLRFTDSSEYIITPEEVADIDGYNAKFDELSDALDTHKEYHKLIGDLPDYLNNEADVYITNVSKIYNVASLSGHYETQTTDGYWK